MLRLGSRGAGAYDSSVDRSSPSVAQCAAAVSDALTPRAEELSAEIYDLLVQEISELRSDGRVLALLEASVGENVATLLHVLQHDISVENVHAPAAAQEYARRLAQRGVPIAALLRAYRIGAARFQEWCLAQLGRSTDNASIVTAGGLRIAEVTAAYIDPGVRGGGVRLRDREGELAPEPQRRPRGPRAGAAEGRAG